jgi:glutathione synthase/RimK-type ligase-like ATP-grasp enzyme
VDNFIVVVDKIEDWQPFFPTEQVVTTDTYLFESKFQNAKNIRVLNLSRKYKYLSHGYYCSLLAEARNHKVLPNLKTINDLSKKSLYINDLDGLQEITTNISDKLSKTEEGAKKITFRIYFSKSQIKGFDKLARQIFEYYPCPILEVTLVKNVIWQIGSVVPVSIKELSVDEEDFFANALDKYSIRIWRTPKKQKAYLYDLAILVDPAEKMPPSDKKALTKLMQACERQHIYAELITKKDFSKINEFDGLFIRETTSISNHTYKFSKVAESEGIVVLDDPDSILKCTNKIFMSNLLDRLKLPGIPGRFVSSTKPAVLNALVEEFGLPLVVKIPDGSFSRGVKKVDDLEELKLVLEQMFKKSDLILVQKFLYTKYDWRIGVLGGEGLFACKYFMSENHWQIYNHEKEKDSDEFSGDSITLPFNDAPENVKRVALGAANGVGKGLYGVDLKEDENGNVYVVEVNDNPNIDSDIEDKVLGDKLYDIVVTWFIEQIKLTK